MFNRFINFGFKSNTIKNSSRILTYSAHGSSAIIDPNSPSLLSNGKRMEFGSEDVYKEEEEDDTQYNSGQNNTPYVKYAIIAAILALGSKMDEYGHCLFNFGVKIYNNWP